MFPRVSATYLDHPTFQLDDFESLLSSHSSPSIITRFSLPLQQRTTSTRFPRLVYPPIHAPNPPHVAHSSSASHYYPPDRVCWCRNSAARDVGPWLNLAGACLLLHGFKTPQFSQTGRMTTHLPSRSARQHIAPSFTFNFS